MKILVCTPRYYPEQFKITDICKHLVKNNEVDVLCNIPDYHNGRYYKGYGLFRKRRQTIDGVNIKRIATFPRGKTLLGLAFSYMSLYIFGMFKTLFIRKKYDLVINYQLSPIYIALIGNRIAKKQNIPSITYILDFWPDSLVAGKSDINNKSKFYKLVEKQSRKAYLDSDYFWISSQGFKNKLLNLGVKEEKIEYIPNFGEDIIKDNTSTDNTKINIDKFINKFKIVYTGNIGKVQKLDLLIEIAKTAKNKKDDSFVFLIVGNGSYKHELEKEIKQNHVDKYFIFYGEQPYEEMSQFYEIADAFYFGLEEKLSFTLPAKLCSYFSYNKPILANAYNECKDTITHYNGGVFINENNCYYQCKYLIDKYNSILNCINNNYYINNFSKSAIMGKIDNAIKNIIDYWYN